jgi:hypothetical protein
MRRPNWWHALGCALVVCSAALVVGCAVALALVTRH